MCQRSTDLLDSSIVHWILTEQSFVRVKRSQWPCPCLHTIMHQHSEFACEWSSGSEDVVRTKEQKNKKRTDGQTEELNPMSPVQLLYSVSIETHSTSLWCNVCVAVTRSYSHSVLTVHAQVQLSTLLQLTKKAASTGPADGNVLCSNRFLRTFCFEAFWWRLFAHSRLGNGQSTHGLQTFPFSVKTCPLLTCWPYSDNKARNKFVWSAQ